LKILFLSEFDPGEIVPAPIKVGKELFNAFTKRGLNVVYLPYFQDGKIYSRFQKLFGFQKITYKVYRTGIFPLVAFVIRFRPQVIHIITPALYYIVLFPLRLFFRLKIVVTLHSINRYVIPHLSKITGYQKFRFLLIDYLLIKYSDCVFVYSQRDKRYISMYYKIKPDKVKVVNNGFNEVNVRKEDFSIHLPLKVAFVGNIKRKEKAFDFLINALSLLNLPVKLSIFSHDKQVKMRDNEPINVDLQFHDPLSELKFRKELVSNDIFILPSKYESFSISLLEAMSTGILFLASNRVGLTERFHEEMTGLIFRKNNTEQLRERINYFLDLNNEQRNQLSLKIINFTKNYSWDKIADNYNRIYKEILIK